MENIYHINSWSISNIFPLYIFNTCIRDPAYCTAAKSVCACVFSSSRQTMYACAWEGPADIRKYTLHVLRKKGKSPVFIKAIFIALNPPKTLSTDKEALRRHNHGGALILSKCYLTESLPFFGGSLLSGSSVRISQLFTLGLWCSLSELMYGRVTDGRLYVMNSYF